MNKFVDIFRYCLFIRRKPCHREWKKRCLKKSTTIGAAVAAAAAAATTASSSSSPSSWSLHKCLPFNISVLHLCHLFSLSIIFTLLVHLYPAILWSRVAYTNGFLPNVAHFAGFCSFGRSFCHFPSILEFIRLFIPNSSHTLYLCRWSFVLPARTKRMYKHTQHNDQTDMNWPKNSAD